jgi:hypothetical protein
MRNAVCRLDAIWLGGEIPLVDNLTFTALHLYPLTSATALALLEGVR